MPKLTLRRLTGAAVPTYEVYADGTKVGQVYRTGSLPSCHRWWAAPVGHLDARILSQPTRARAVDELLAVVLS